MNDIELEFLTTLTYCHITPYEVQEVVAGWIDDDEANMEMSSGFVIRLRTGFGYVVSKRNRRLNIIRAITRTFDDEPTFLYERARHWNFNKEELNANLPLAKQEAKYPATDRPSGGEACSRPVVRIQAPQPGA